MKNTRPFRTVHVLGLLTGRVLTRDTICEQLEILSWMTGDAVYLHQYARLADQVGPHILAQHPDARLVLEEAGLVTPENASKWADTWEERYGVEMEIPKLLPHQFERIDPLSELCEKIHPDQITTL